MSDELVVKAALDPVLAVTLAVVNVEPVNVEEVLAVVIAGFSTFLLISEFHEIVRLTIVPQMSLD